MKQLFSVAALSLALLTQSFAQGKPHHMLFDLTSGDTATHQRVIRWVKGIVASYPDATIEVVFYGKALPMIETNLSSVASDVTKLAAGKNVIFTACEQAMKIHNVDKSMLLPGVKTVPDALIELVSKQAEGYGYIKVTN